MSNSSNNKPVSELRDGTIKIAIFRNEGKEEGDRPGLPPFYVPVIMRAS